MDDHSNETSHAAVSADALDEAESRRDEVNDIIERGPGLANRSGALAFLALLVVIAAAAHFVFSARGGGAYLQRLDAELLNHAELSLASMSGDAPMAVAPSWPLGMYESLRRDMLLYGALGALAAYVWSRSAGARARRDAFLVHDKLTAELAELRARLDAAESGAPGAAAPEKKG